MEHVASKLENNWPFFSSFNPSPSMPSVATGDRKQFQYLQIVFSNKTRSLIQLMRRHLLAFFKMPNGVTMPLALLSCFCCSQSTKFHSKAFNSFSVRRFSTKPFEMFHARFVPVKSPKNLLQKRLRRGLMFICISDFER